MFLFTFFYGQSFSQCKDVVILPLHFLLHIIFIFETLKKIVAFLSGVLHRWKSHTLSLVWRGVVIKTPMLVFALVPMIIGFI
jgi:hypothetical protein